MGSSLLTTVNSNHCSSYWDDFTSLETAKCYSEAEVVKLVDQERE